MSYDGMNSKPVDAYRFTVGDMVSLRNSCHFAQKGERAQIAARVVGSNYLVRFVDARRGLLYQFHDNELDGKANDTP